MKLQRSLPAAITTFVFLLLTLLLFACQSSEPDPETRKQKGVAFTSWWPGEYSHPDADVSLKNIKDSGANWISLLVCGYQTDITSTAIMTTSMTPTVPI